MIEFAHLLNRREGVVVRKWTFTKMALEIRKVDGRAYESSWPYTQQWVDITTALDRHLLSKTFSGEVDGKAVTFDLLGWGNFNAVYKFTDPNFDLTVGNKDYVLRVLISNDTSKMRYMPHAADTAERVARIWSEGEKYKRDTAVCSFEITIDSSLQEITAHVVPFFKILPNPLSVEQQVECLIQYFLDTGRVIMDPFLGNIVLLEGDDGEPFPFPVDRAFAVRCRDYVRDNNASEDREDEAQLRTSPVSVEYHDAMIRRYEEIWKGVTAEGVKIVIATVKSLLFIQFNGMSEEIKQRLRGQFSDIQTMLFSLSLAYDKFRLLEVFNRFAPRWFNFEVNDGNASTKPLHQEADMEGDFYRPPPPAPTLFRPTPTLPLKKQSNSAAAPVDEPFAI